MNGTGDEDSPAAIDDKGLSIVGDAAVDQLQPEKDDEEEADGGGEK